MDESLKKLVWDWAFRSEREGVPTGLIENPKLPDWVLEKITSVEPFRAQVIEDATLYWAMPMPFGFGMELFVPENIEISPFQNWQETIRNFTAKMEYCEDMSGRECYRYEVKLERIGRENDEWRIIEIFDQTERAQTTKVFEFLKNLHAEKRNK